MRFIELSRRHFLQAAASAGALGAMMPARARAAGEAGVLRVASYGDLQVLDPAFQLGAPENAICDLIYHRLAVFKGNDDTSVEPDAAAAIEQTDEKHIAFTLKPGIMWSGDFGEMTAEDVKYSFERIIDPKMESPYAGDWAALDHVEVTDKYSGVLVLKDFSPTVWTIAIPGNSGIIVCKKAVEALPEKKFTTEVPAYSGRYAITEWTAKQRTVFEPNPKWSGDAVAFKQIVIVPIEDAAAREIAFEAGDIDCCEVSLGTLARYRKDGLPEGAKLLDVPSLAYVWIGLNIDNPALADVRVRRAIQSAVDVDQVVEAGYFGAAERSTGIVAPSLLGHRNIEPRKRDVEGAKALLKEAGAEGLALTLDVGLDSHELNMAQVVQSSLAEVGIELTIKQNDSATFWTIGDEKSGDQWKQMQLILNRFSMSPDPAYATEWFTPEQVGVWNWERFNNEEFGKLHADAKFEKDQAKRAAMYVRMQDLMEESGAYIFLTHERRAYIYRNTIVAALNPAGEPLLRLFKSA